MADANASVEQLVGMIQMHRERVESALEHTVREGITPKTKLPAMNLKLCRSLRGHYGKVYSMHWASDSRKLVSASQDGKLILWSAFTTNKIAAIPLRSSWVMTCAYSPSSNFVASGGLDNVCTVYRADDASLAAPQIRPVAELSHHEGYLSCCRFIDDTHMVTSSGDATCILWDVANRVPISIFSGHEADVMSVAPSTDGFTFVSGSVDSTARLWDTRARAKDRAAITFVGHESDINSVDYRDTARLVASGSDDSQCRVFDMRTYCTLATLTHSHVVCGISSVSFSATCRILFAGYDDYAVRGWDTLDRSNCAVLNGHENRVSSLGMSKNGHALGTASWDSSIRIWA